MDFLYQWVLLVFVFGAALASPGPDMVMAVRNSLLYSRKTGIFTALGFAAGIAIHIGYTLVGLAAVIAQSVLLFSIIKFAGAAYLLYMGYKALRSKGFNGGDENGQTPVRHMPVMKAWTAGFLTNLLNPKATLFFLAVFSQFITPETTVIQQAAFALTCIVMAIIWFSGVSIILTNPVIKSAFLKASKWIDRVCGGLFVLLGVRLALTKGVTP